MDCENGSAGGEMPTVEFRVLGPVAAYVDHQQVPIGPPQQCAVLASLLVDAGHVVPAEVLVQRSWEQPSPRSRRTLQTYIARIRRLLQQAGIAETAQLVRGAGGYVLLVERDFIDLHRYRGLVDKAGKPGCPGGESLVLLREAMSLWRGEPLAGLPGQWADSFRVGLGLQRVDGALAWAQAEIDAGHPGTAIDTLASVLAEHPLHEPVAATLIRALYEAGHTARALECYSATRQRLVEELGADPGPELMQLHRTVLRGRPEGPSVRARPVPRQLPFATPAFAGRAREIEYLDTMLAQGRPAIPVCAISGTAGVGKTMLALHWAHRVADRFPDGQLYLNLHGFDPTDMPMPPAVAMRRLLQGLDVRPDRIPSDVDAQGALYRSLLAAHRALVLLDNARDADQLRPLLPGTSSSLVLITSRDRLTGLVARGARPIVLELLSDAEAHDLLAGHLGPERLVAEPQAAARLVAGCTRLPLALAVVAARAATQTALPLASFADELADRQERLNVLDTNDPMTAPRAVFSWSYKHLTPAAARLFRLLGIHSGPDIAVAAAASLIGRSVAETRRILAELVQANLLDEYRPSRFMLHDLLRAYAAELAGSVEGDDDRGEATRRVLGHYLHSAYAAARMLTPQWEPIQPEPAVPGTEVERPSDDDAALAWFGAEHHTLLAAAELAAGTENRTHAWQLAWTLASYLERRGHWEDLAATQSAAIAARADHVDRTAFSFHHRFLAHAHLQLARFTEAEAELNIALDLERRAGNDSGAARVHLTLSRMWEYRGDYANGLSHAQQALALHRGAGNIRGQANALNNTGYFQARLGDCKAAVVTCEEALRLLQAAGDRLGEAATWDSLGYAHHHLNAHAQAIECYKRAVELYGELGYRAQEADTLASLGETHLAIGASASARQAWQAAVDLLAEAGGPGVERLRAKLIALDTPPT